MKSMFKNVERFSAVIGGDTVCEGNISSPGSVRIDGILRGDISTSATVYIGVDGRVVGNITAIRVILMGRVDGRIDAEERIELSGTGSIYGDVVSANFVVAEGATINGSCIVSDKRLESAVQHELTAVA